MANTGLTFNIINGKVVIYAAPPEDSEAPKKYNFQLSGKIADVTSGESLPNALIKVKGTNKGTVSNVDGHFTLFKVPTDTSTIVIDYLGYMTKEIKLSPDLPFSEIEIELQSDIEMLDDITISDSYDQPIAVNREISRMAFNPKALQTLPTLGEHDLFRTLQYMPGVSATNESSSGLSIRGSLPSQNLVLLDGFTLYHLDHFFGVFSALNSDVIKDVQIYKSGYSAKYGGRVSGVVDITGKSGGADKATYSIGANLLSLRATAQIPIGKKVSVLASFRRSFTDAVQSDLYKNLFDIVRENDDQINRPVENDRFEEIEPEFYFTDINFKTAYRPSNKDIISLSAYGGRDHLYGETIDSASFAPLDIFYQESLTERNEWGNGGVGLRWGRQWNDNYYSNLRFTFSSFDRNYNFNYQYQLDSAQQSQKANFDFTQTNRIEDANFLFDNTYTINNQWSLDFGIHANEYRIRYQTSSNGKVADEQDNEGKISSLYITGHYDLNPDFRISAGFRSNRHEINDTSYFEPRLSANYQISEKLNLKAAYGVYHQFLNQVLYDHPYNGTQNFWAFSNLEGIPVVKSKHHVIGATYQNNGFLVDLEAYYKDLSGIVEFNLVPFFVKEESLDLGFLVGGEGRMRGIDLMVQKEIGKYKGWVSYSLSRSLQSFPAVEKGIFYPSLQDQTHEINIVNMATLGRWDVSAAWIYGSGSPYREYDVLYFTNDQGTVEDFIVVKDRTAIVRLPDYHRLDLSVAYDLNFKKGSGQVGMSIFNSYARKNIKTRKINISELQKAIGTKNQPLPTYRDQILIGFTPSFFVNFTF
nr:TonB-dependent receptor [Fulvivirga aurantia]